MNYSHVLGFLIAASVVVIGIVTSTQHWQIFLNEHAFLVVIGGTIAASLVSFPLNHLFKMMKVVWNRIVGNSQAPHIQVVREVVDLAKGYWQDEGFLEKSVESIKTPFLREAIQLQIDGGIPNSKIDVILRKRTEVHLVRYESDAHIFRTMARFPPAFGLLGAVLGMIALMAGLGSPDSFKTIGPSMAMALVATMYGIALANFVFVPIGENLAKFSKEDHLMRNIVIDALKLLREREHPAVVEEYLRSYLLSSERFKLDDNSKKAA
jgi:chemotaxis protein MotA